MERETHMQLDRTEAKVDNLIEGMKVLLNQTTEDTLMGFYEEEIASEEGELHHLNSDRKVEQFFKILEEETKEPEEVEERTEEQEEYRQP